jgi:hypothetical protein
MPAEPADDCKGQEDEDVPYDLYALGSLCRCSTSQVCSDSNHHTEWCYIDAMDSCIDSVQGANGVWSERACVAPSQHGADENETAETASTASEEPQSPLHRPAVMATWDDHDFCA